MNKYIVLSLCVSLSAVLCEYINGKQGDECEWEGLKGKCVKETRCLTTLDDDSPKHPVCSKQFGEKIICCTDCKLVNNTKNAIFIPPSGLFWKNGQKARDNCLQYLQDLPYKCKEDGFYAGITRDLDEDNRCYEYSEWDVGSTSSEDKKPSAEYPHKITDMPRVYKTREGARKRVPIDEGKLRSAVDDVIAGASIRGTAKGYGLAVMTLKRGEQQFVAVGVSNRWDSTFWQIHNIKRIIRHPEFNDWNRFYYDIALIETETPIKFNENVLPACLHVEEDASVEEAITTPQKALVGCNETRLNFTERIKTVDQTVMLKEFSADECKALSFNIEFDHKTQICYGSEIFHREPFYCTMVESNPLMITTQFSSCVHTAIGLSIPVVGCDVGFCQMFTRVSPFVPWIESIVWPDEP